MNETKNTTKPAGYYYAGGGYRWEGSDFPMCSICQDEPAAYATATSGVVLCDSPSCHNHYVVSECDPIQFYREENHDPSR